MEWSFRQCDPEYGQMMAVCLQVRTRCSLAARPYFCLTRRGADLAELCVQDRLKVALGGFDVAVSKKKGLIEVLPSKLNKARLCASVLQL